MKLKKPQRLAIISKILSDNPNKVLTFNFFTEKFQAAKSTISSDINTLKNLYALENLGEIQTITGARGGVKYSPYVSKNEALTFINYLCERLSEDERRLPGGFLYMIDLIYDPTIIEKIGNIFATLIDSREADYVVTMETKGIPMSTMVARAMNLPLLIIRKNTKVSEGPSISITYATGRNQKIQGMTLPLKSIKKGSKVIVIDDFMRGGGTLKGINDLMKEFDAEVLKSAVLISTKSPENKKIDDYISLIELEEGSMYNRITPSKTFKSVKI